MNQKLTAQQRKALHLYYERLAKALNDAGYDMNTFIMEAPTLELPWTKESIKELWRVAQKAMTGKESTEDLDKIEIDSIYIPFDKRIAEISGVHVEFPSEETMMEEQR